MKQIIECVPNFSEGRNPDIINQISQAIQSVGDIKLIDIDPGKATNRTVITFVGSPEEVCEAVFRAVKRASELIDMRKHTGEHPRFGATDVLPLVPVKGINLEETAEYARKLAKRIGEELSIPVYCYESAATEEKRVNLANCRSGEYEGLPSKLISPEWKPDFGPAEFNAKVARTGAIAVGARNFLVAYNINLNTTSTRIANSIAFDIREKGRVKRVGGQLTGKPLLDENGNTLYEPGLLKAVKGIGWYIEEYGVSQLSFNLTDITTTSVHQVFEASCQRAETKGVRVTGSEIVGVVPLQVLIDAGKYFLHKQKRSAGISDQEIIKIAIKSLGLNDLSIFDPEKKIIEYLIMDKTEKSLYKLTLKEFVEETASESPAPGGGSVSASMGAMGASLGTMVANLSSHKKGWDDRWAEFAKWAEKGKKYQDGLLQLIDEDTRAFNGIMLAYKMPKESPEQELERKNAIQIAIRHAMEVPMKVMQLSYQSMEVIKEMAIKGNPNSVSDAGVGALAARSAVLGAAMNVRINAGSCQDKKFVSEIINQVDEIEKLTISIEKEILTIVDKQIATKP